MGLVHPSRRNEAGGGGEAAMVAMAGRMPARRLAGLPVETAAISAGGGVGGFARYGLTLAMPPTSGGFPWATFATNVIGCFLIGALMVLVTDVWTDHRLARLFLGVGILGGFTTFSTYIADVRRLAAAGEVGVALIYLVATLVAALLATHFAILAATRIIRRHPGRGAW